MPNPTVSVTEIVYVGPAMGRMAEERPRVLDLGGIYDVKPLIEMGFTEVKLNTSETVRVKGLFSNLEELVDNHA